MTPNKFTLLIVDCQNDYTQKDGSLYIESCDIVIPKICKFMEDNKDHIDRVILAKSNHPENYCIFKGHGGGYPKHCVEKTQGNKIDNRILKTLKRTKLNYVELNHGEVHDFEENSVSKYSRIIDETFVLATSTDACRIMTDDIVLCGVSGDIMVSETIKDLCKQLKNDNIYLFIDGVASVNKDIIMDILETYDTMNIL